jgi:hypothetical protein
MGEGEGILKKFFGASHAGGVLRHGNFLGQLTDLPFQAGDSFVL